MSLSAAVIDALIEAGATREQLAAAIKADIATRDAEQAAKLEKRRAGNRTRQQRKRDRDSNAESRVTVVTERDACDGSPNDINLTPSVPSVVSDETTSPVLQPEHVVEAWNDLAQATGLREVKKLTPQRRRKLAVRIRQNTIDEFTEAIGAIGRSPFLRGENDRGWRADFDWMLEPRNFTKLIEGNYDR